MFTITNFTKLYDVDISQVKEEKMVGNTFYDQKSCL